jgi:hypothetical protein
MTGNAPAKQFLHTCGPGPRHAHRSQRVVQLMGQVTKNARPARETYGRRAAKPLGQLFLDFLERNNEMLKAALTNKEPMTK